MTLVINNGLSSYKRRMNDMLIDIDKKREEIIQQHQQLLHEKTKKYRFIKSSLQL